MLTATTLSYTIIIRRSNNNRNVFVTLQRDGGVKPGFWWRDGRQEKKDGGCSRWARCKQTWKQTCEEEEKRSGSSTGTDLQLRLGEEFFQQPCISLAKAFLGKVSYWHLIWRRSVALQRIIHACGVLVKGQCSRGFFNASVSPVDVTQPLSLCTMNWMFLQNPGQQ